MKNGSKTRKIHKKITKSQNGQPSQPSNAAALRSECRNIGSTFFRMSRHWEVNVAALGMLQISKSPWMLRHWEMNVAACEGTQAQCRGIHFSMPRHWRVDRVDFFFVFVFCVSFAFLIRFSFLFLFFLFFSFPILLSTNISCFLWKLQKIEKKGKTKNEHTIVFIRILDMNHFDIYFSNILFLCIMLSMPFNIIVLYFSKNINI